MVASFNTTDNVLLFYLSFVLFLGSPLVAIACIVGHLRVIVGSGRLSRPVLVLLVVGSVALGAMAASMLHGAQGRPLLGFHRAAFWLFATAGVLLPISLLREWRK